MKYQLRNGIIVSIPASTYYTCPVKVEHVPKGAYNPKEWTEGCICAMLIGAGGNMDPASWQGGAYGASYDVVGIYVEESPTPTIWQRIVSPFKAAWVAVRLAVFCIRVKFGKDEVRPMTAQPLTLEQGIILTGYTNVMLAPFPDFHKDAEKRIGRPILIHELADPKLVEKLKELYLPDFLSLVSGMEAPK